MNNEKSCNMVGREPTEFEVKQISEYVQERFGKLRKAMLISNITCFIMGVLGIVSFITEIDISNITTFHETLRPSIMTAVFGLFFLLVACGLIVPLTKLKKLYNGYNKGEFTLFDGTAVEVAKSSSMSRLHCFINIYFKSDDVENQICDWWSIPERYCNSDNISDGSKVILIVPNSTETQKVNPFIFAGFNDTAVKE